MFETVMDATELRFATKKFTVDDMKDKLEAQGWTENEELTFASKKFSIDDMENMLANQGWEATNDFNYATVSSNAAVAVLKDAGWVLVA